jgi:hypothetical protein
MSHKYERTLKLNGNIKFEKGGRKYLIKINFCDLFSRGLEKELKERPGTVNLPLVHQWNVLV